VSIQGPCSHPVLLAVDDTKENRWANDIDGAALAAQPGKSQGAVTEEAGLNAHRAKRPLAKAPVPVGPTLSLAPDDTSVFTEQLHAAKLSRGRQR
jgi:hypothetical protein